MNRNDTDAFDLALSEELARRSPAHGDVTAAHPELQELAVYVDGSLAGSARERLEEHLASCGTCRRVVMETTLAVHGRDAETRTDIPSLGGTGWRPWRLSFGLVAATVAVAIGFSWLRPETLSDAARLAEAGVSVAVIEAAGPELSRRAVEALAGHWPRPDGLERFLAGDLPVMRDASNAAAPVPIAPRWSVISAQRPRFTWRLDLAATEYELLVVDESEELVVAFSVPVVDVVAGEASAAYPADAVPLAPGKAYAWKVNASIEGEWVASPYVPFIRASVDEQAGHEAELARVAASPLFRALTLATSGRYRPALQALQRVDEPERGRLVGSVLAHQQFFAQDLEREHRRWTGE